MRSSPDTRQQYVEAMNGVLEQLAASHIEDSDGHMVLLENNPEIYPGQELLNPHVSGYYPQPRDVTDEIAQVAQEHYLSARDALAARKGTFEKIHEAGEHLSQGNNVAVITRHDNLTDIAYALKMTDDLLRDQGYEPNASAIVISEMLHKIGHKFKFRGVPQEVPAISTLQVICSDIYKSIPPTKTTQSEINKLPNAEVVWYEVGRHNKTMLRLLRRQLARGGVLLGLAPTGTTKVAVSGSGLELAPLNDKTVGLMSHRKTGVLRMLVEYEGKAPFAHIAGDLVKIQDAEEAEEALEVLAKADTRGIQSSGDLEAELLKRFGGVALDRQQDDGSESSG